MLLTILRITLRMGMAGGAWASGGHGEAPRGGAPGTAVSLCYSRLHLAHRCNGDVQLVGRRVAYLVQAVRVRRHEGVADDVPVAACDGKRRNSRTRQSPLARLGVGILAVSLRPCSPAAVKSSAGGRRVSAITGDTVSDTWQACNNGGDVRTHLD